MLPCLRFVCAAISLSILAVSRLPAQSPVSPAETNRIADELWSKIMLRCGSTYYYVDSNIGHGADVGKSLRDFQDRNKSEAEIPVYVTEYRQVQTSIFPKTITLGSSDINKVSDGRLDTLQIEDLQWFGVFQFASTRWRKGVSTIPLLKTGAVDWASYESPPGLKSKSPEEAVARKTVEPYKVALSPFLSFADSNQITLQAWKIAGVWSFARGFPVSPLTDGGLSKRYTLEEISGTRQHHLPICPSGQEDVDISKGGTRTPASSSSTLHIAAGDTVSSTDGLRSIEWTPQSPVRVDGTLDLVLSRMPSVFKDSIAAHGLRGDYTSELGFIMRALQACSEITPAVASTFTRQGVEMPAAYPGKYSACGSQAVDVSAEAHPILRPDRRIDMMIFPVSTWKEAKGFRVTVAFEPKGGDSAQRKAGFEPYGIFAATILPKP